MKVLVLGRGEDSDRTSIIVTCYCFMITDVNTSGIIHCSKVPQMYITETTVEWDVLPRHQ